MRFGLYNLILEKNYKKLGTRFIRGIYQKHGKPNLIHTNDVKFGIFVADIIKKIQNSFCCYSAQLRYY